MLVLFAVGVTPIVWLMPIAAFVVIEKVMPAPAVLRAISGLALVAWEGTGEHCSFRSTRIPELTHDPSGRQERRFRQ